MPEYAAAWCAMGTVAGKAERYEEALENFERALEINPKDSEACYAKGLVLAKLEKYDSALE